MLKPNSIHPKTYYNNSTFKQVKENPTPRQRTKFQKLDGTNNDRDNMEKVER